MQKELKSGWDYASKQMGSDYAVHLSDEYIANIDDEIQKLADDMNKLGMNDLGKEQLKGFVAEYWQADTFNIESALRGSDHRAIVEGSTKHASVDVSTNFGKDYSLKYYQNPKASVKAQAKNVRQAYHEYLSKPRQGPGLSFEQYLEKHGYIKDPSIKKLIADYREFLASNDKDNLTLEQFFQRHGEDYDIASLLTSVYNGQDRLIPIDQIKDAVEYLNKEIAKEGSKESSHRAAILENYRETLEKLVDRISDGTGIESRALTKKEAETIASLIKEEKFKPEDFGLILSDIVTAEYIIQQALTAGYTAAVITLVMQLVPEIFKAIDYLIKNDKIDVSQLKKIGTTAISASAEGFLRGSIASALTISCMAGKLGEQFINVNPHIIGAMTVIVLDIAKNSILVALGKMTPREMGQRITKDLLISSAALAGGALGQMIAPELPVVGYMLGSLLGSCIASVVLNLGENCMIAFCVDTGFTCFGLVKQDYQLSEEILSEMGISIADISRTEIKRTKVKTAQVKHVEIKRKRYETVQLTMVRRGVIGVNTIGYV